MELLWAFGSNLSSVVGAYLLVALFYLGVTWVRIRKLNHRPDPPFALWYLPIAILGVVLGLFVFENLFYSPNFWITRSAHSFNYETRQGFMIIIALSTYPIALAIAHRIAIRIFKAQSFSLKSMKTAKHAVLQALLTLLAGLSFLFAVLGGVLSFYTIKATGKWGNFGAGYQRGIAELNRPFPTEIIVFLISLCIFFGLIYWKRRLAK